MPRSGPFSGHLTHSVEQVTKITGLGRTSVYEQIRTGQLIARKVGRRTVILQSDLIRWLESRPVLTASCEQAGAADEVVHPNQLHRFTDSQPKPKPMNA
jgi:excisionase family DNA binding protein